MATSLPTLEQLLHRIIQDICFIGDVSETSAQSESFQNTVCLLRKRMRTVRRWRNGSEMTDPEQIQEMVESILDTRYSLMAIKSKIVEDEVAELDADRCKLTSDLVGKKEELWKSFQMFQRQMDKIAENEEELIVNGCDKDLSIHEETLADILKSLAEIKTEMKESEHRRSAESLRRLSVISTARDCFQSNPLRNRVLAAVGRIKRTLIIFKHGGHRNKGTAEEMTTCLENDVEVLLRQLQKLSRWKEDKETFTEHDLDDLELIIFAIEKHQKLRDLNTSEENKDMQEKFTELEDLDLLNEQDERLI